MDELTVDFAVLSGHAQSIAQHIDATGIDLDRLDEIVKELASSWQGDAHDEFHRAIDEWHSAASDLRKRMHWIRGIVITAHENHAKAVHTNVAIWQG